MWECAGNRWINRGSIKGIDGAPGPAGSDGKSATIAVGSVTGGATASVTNVGTASDAIFNFVLPKGDKGEKGDKGDKGDPGSASESIDDTTISTETSWSSQKTSTELEQIYDSGFASRNLFDEKYPNISSDITYKAIPVNGVVTMSTSAPLNTKGGANLFILSGNVSSGASTPQNGVSIGNNRTVEPTEGYITIVYRNTDGVDPRDFNTQIEYGLNATEYTQYAKSNVELDNEIDGKISKPSSASNGQVLTYNGSEWVAQTPTSGGAEIDDTTTSSSTVWSSSKVNSELDSWHSVNGEKEVITATTTGVQTITFSGTQTNYAYKLYANTSDGSTVEIKTSSFTKTGGGGIMGGDQWDTGNLAYTVDVKLSETQFALRRTKVQKI